MPQGRRKTPFGGKAKKEQLQQKRQRIRSNRADTDVPDPAAKEVTDNLNEVSEVSATVIDKSKSDKSSAFMDVTFSSGASGRGKFDLIFQKESNVDIAQRREMARKPYKTVDDEELEKDVQDFFPESCDYPQRPKWNKSMSKQQVEANEAKYFRQYVSDIMDKHEQNLSFFELNLETWRQLWRVVEMSDILLLIVDARYPSAMMPPSLVKGVHPKPVLLVLNKIDLIPPALALAWKAYFQEKYDNVHVTFFTSCPAYNLRNYANFTQYDEGLQFRRLRGKISMAKEGALQIFNTVKNIMGDKADLKGWEEKINNYKDEAADENNIDTEEHENVTLTLGMVGHPNVGKSSLINSLVGRRVVSVSKTPGHTKHFQTIFISPSVRLCDCPGLVFPSMVPRPFQVVLGSYPISQVREPYSVVQLLAERLDLPKLLKLEARPQWTTYDICEAWAEKRGYVTARSNRPDVARAANHIMRMALEGKLSLALRPPDYNKDKWTHHPDIEIIEDLLAIHKVKEQEKAAELDAEKSDESEDSMDEEEETTTTVDFVGNNKFNALTIE